VVEPLLPLPGEWCKRVGWYSRGWGGPRDNGGGCSLCDHARGAVLRDSVAGLPYARRRLPEGCAQGGGGCSPLSPARGVVFVVRWAGVGDMRLPVSSVSS